MAEPLSVVLAGMALATAIKDAMEVWEKIEESFARVSQNLRDAQQLVGDTRTTLDHLNEFCEEHNAILDKSEKTKIALINLARKMNAVHTTCSRLIPPISEKIFKKYKLKYYVWKNGRKIEAEIMKLQRDIDSCLTLFAVFASVRTEVRLVEFQDVSLARSEAILNALSPRSDQDNRIRAFARPQAMIPPIPSLESEVANRYLEFQAVTVYDRLGYLATPDSPSENELILVFDLRSLDSTLRLEDYSSQNRESLHKTAVRSALEIQHLLQPHAERLSLDTGRVVLAKFAQMLYALGMRNHYEEFTRLIRLWEARFKKVLVRQFGEEWERNANADENYEKAKSSPGVLEDWERAIFEKATLLNTYTYDWNALVPYPVPYSNYTRFKYN